MAKEPIPTSRLRRSATVGRLAAEQAARQLGTRAANLTRDEQRANEALARRQVETAEQIVAALGTMKGAAMKLGQVMSFLDVGLVPPEYREQFQAKLAELRDAAPKVSFKDMKKVIEQEYGEKLENVFETFDPKAMAAEIRSRIDEELDYELEAQNQRTLARIFRGHPFIVIPDVVTSLSHERVVVSEFVSGRGFEEMKQLPDAERDRIAEIIFRFYFGCMYRHHQFSGDPHPGNCMLLDDGRMAFLDFGLFKRIPASVAEFELQTQRLGIERKGKELIEFLHQGGFIGDPSYYDPQGILEQFDDFTWWYTRDEEIHLEPEVATEVIIQMSDPRSRHFGKMRHETLPPDHLFGRRLEMLTLAVMSQLRATGSWHRIAREWIYGDAPVTELGAAEAEFYAGRGREPVGR